MSDHSPVSASSPLRRLLPVLVLLAVLTLGASASAATPATVPVPVATSEPADPAGAPAVSPDGADDHDGDFGWGPSRIVWGGFGWLGLVLVTAVLLRRQASRRR
ncbi:hypothetical protein SAMN04488563_2469 [Jiangella alkaliphila]|uniref:MYXO-CTERM domain-containing protein n=1 Tax=Jiangella alkaliphila TaxID=419479 RepID=A0A1H2JB23_9ACTN|nr:hypothetical protein SAMN04488563_2469 [Jiangella alkaliphila]